MEQPTTQTPSRAQHLIELQRNREEYQRQLDRQAERPSQRRRHNPTMSRTDTIDYDEIRRHFERREREEAFNRARREANDALLQQEQLMEQRAQALSQAQARADSFSRRATRSMHQVPQNPSQSQHRVYLINCKSCGTFLTDRGMKAVLLLRPHITLYSTDAMPNCGALHAPSRLAEPSAPHEPVVERTCDCLTQSLGCYGCGSAVGYHIVSPCQRCTNSVAKHQRSSNGHRTVLHCAEISVRERRYVPGEPGVMVAPYLPPYPHMLTYSQAYPGSRYANANRQNEEDEEDDDELDEEEDEDEFEDEEEKAYRNDPFIYAHPPSKYRNLKRGDVLFWSDLAAGGERSPPIDSDDYLSLPPAGR